MSVAVVGTRGFPDVQGGVERHCEELYTRLAARGVKITVFLRSPYVSGVERHTVWRGIHRQRVWTPRRKSLEAVWHSLASVLLARVQGERLLHVHAVGPGLVVPLARLLGMRVVFTHHGRDYMRQKWGRLAKLALRAGEYAAIRHSDEVLAVSREIVDWLEERFGRKAIYAPNGIAMESASPARVDSTLASFGLSEGEYAVTVARLVPEKGVHDLIEAVSGGDVLPTLLVIGASDHRSEYAEELRRRSTPVVRFAGEQPHEVTLDLVRGARLFVLPSYHEGLPIALLEAMASGTPAVASDIAPHRDIITDGVDGWLFRVGNVADLRQTISRAWRSSEKALAGIARKSVEATGRFGWESTVESVLAAYRSSVAKRETSR